MSNGTPKMPSQKPTKGEAIGNLLDAFEAAAKADEDGTQYWSARDLYPMLGYASWQKFESVIEKAASACKTLGEDATDHFTHTDKLVILGSGAERRIEDIELTRFACYLVAQNGDPAKPEIAAAQMYFAVQTRRQEVADLAATTRPPLSEDERRVLLRDEMKHHNKSLSSAAKAAGVVQPIDYAIFMNEGYKGLYGGLDKAGIQRRKRLTSKDDILDRMPAAELAANMFRATQTEEKLRREQIQGKAAASRTHYQVGLRVRRTIEETSGAMPEDYEAVEHVKEARKRVKAEKKPKTISKK